MKKKREVSVIKVYNEKSDSREAEVSREVKKSFLDIWPWLKNNKENKISIFHNIKCFSETVKDLDIVIIGDLPAEPEITVRLTSNGHPVNKIKIRSFCFTVELKEHPPERVSFSGSKLFVDYSGKKSCVTDQSEAQKFSLKNYLEDSCVISSAPFIQT